MSIIQNFLYFFKKIWQGSTIENRDRKNKNLDFKQNSITNSLEDLEKTGLLTVERVFNEKKISEENKERLVYASQLPAHIVSWVVGKASGMHLIKFSPEIQSQISSGFFTATGGVARNQSGQIMAIGTSANLLLLSPIILYQVGTIAFGAYHLKKINESLEKINKKLDKISSFLINKRSAEIEGHCLELLHLSKGIIDFKKQGNITEVFNRVNLIKNIRIMNLPNLLHLKKNLQQELNQLKVLERKSWFGSEKEAIALLDSVGSYKTTLVDYSYSLLLDVISSEIEVVFSINNSSEEVKSRLSSFNDHRKCLKEYSSNFEKTLNDKFSELIEDSWSDVEDIEERRKNIKTPWKRIKKSITELDITYKKHVQFIEDKIKPRNNSILLKIEATQKHKKSA